MSANQHRIRSETPKARKATAMPNKRETKKMAAMDFEPWPADTIRRMERDFSAAGWSLKPTSEIGVDLRIATALMSKTKAELVQAAHGLGEDLLPLIDHLTETADRPPGSGRCRRQRDSAAFDSGCRDRSRRLGRSQRAPVQGGEGHGIGLWPRDREPAGDGGAFYSL
jgi:hypothetical protein